MATATAPLPHRPATTPAINSKVVVRAVTISLHAGYAVSARPDMQEALALVPGEPQDTALMRTVH